MYQASANSRQWASPAPRSLLFVPASNERAIEKVRQGEADAIVLDLEDMVSATDKPAAREQLVKTLADAGFGERQVVVRVNGLDTEWGADDIAAVAGCDMDALLLPKIDSAAILANYIERIDAAGGREVEIWILAETPRGILDLDRIVRSSDRIRAIVVGTQDLIKSLGIAPDGPRTGLAPILSHCVVAARANGLAVIDGVFIDTRDEEGLRSICRQGRAFGFDGKALIHPAQIEAANAIFGEAGE
jgi:citrate lyase subunit beta/citryl-CoA lyase